MHILVIDDDPLAGELTGLVLESAGHEIALAENAIEATEQLDATRFDLIVSDMNMPMVSGIDLFRELRAQGNRIPFILLTGDEPEALLAMEPDLDGCVLKDAQIDTTLLDAIAKLQP